MGSLVHDIIYVEKYTLEIAHEKIYEDRNRPVMCGIVSMRHRIFCFPEAKCEYTAICCYSERSRFIFQKWSNKENHILIHLAHLP